MKLDLLATLKYLKENNLPGFIQYDLVENKFFIDLDSQAKSHMYLTEDGVLLKRYGETSKLFNEELTEEFLKELCFEFKNCLCGRDYGSISWFSKCKEYGISTNS